MNCIICNEPLGSTRPIWGTAYENQCHLDCTDALLGIILDLRQNGSSYSKGIAEVFFTATRETLMRERLGAS